MNTADNNSTNNTNNTNSTNSINTRKAGNDSNAGNKNNNGIYSNEIIFSQFGNENSSRGGNVFRVLEITAGNHVSSLGYGRDTLMKYNIAWILASQRIHYYRMPNYGEAVRVSTWPGKKRLAVYPRFYKIEDLSGNILVESSSRWTLMNLDTRAIEMKPKLDISFDEVVTGKELEQVKNVRIPKNDTENPLNFDFTVCKHHIDTNGHMNNAEYVDLVMLAAKKAQEEKKLQEEKRLQTAGDSFSLQIQFKNELKLGEKSEIRTFLSSDGSIYVTGVCRKKDSFYALIENISR